LLPRIVSIVYDITSSEYFVHPRCFLYLGKNENGNLIVGKESWDVYSTVMNIKGFSEVRSTYQILPESELTSDQFKSDFSP